mgnify:FL=1
MGNIYSIYNNYKNDYNDLDEKYSKLKVANDSNKTKIDILQKTIENLENEVVKKEVILGNEKDANRINEKKIETLISKQDSDEINNENLIYNLEQNNIELEGELEITEKKMEELKSINKEVEWDGIENGKKLKFVKNKLDICEQKCIDKCNQINEYDNIIEDLIQKNNKSNQEKQIIKQNIKDVINYYNNNKDIIISEILAHNNTIIPDYIEKNIIGYIYTFLLNKIEGHICKIEDI